jgi:LytS/YehU family sensor histidine kinase
MVLLNRLISALLNLPVMMEKIFAKQRAHINFQNDPVVDFSIIIITLVVFGVGIIIAVVQKIQQDQLKVQNSEKEKISSELAFLKAQINPHFFFNILHTIHALTETDTRSAGDSIYTLSHMMRYVLYDTKNDETTLEKEVNFVEDYIKLMQLRLTDQVQIIFDKPNNLRNVKVVPMLFLPFIENAFKHGISSIHPSYIYIGIKQIGRTLNIEVRNSIFIEKAENLEESNGIGLINTQRRLDLIYPGKHQLKVESSQVANEFTVQLNLTL